MTLSPNNYGPPAAQRRALRAVALFEFTKGALVLAGGIAALMLMHRDAWVIAESVLALLHISPDRHYAQVFLDFADRVTDARLWAAARLAGVYSILRFSEAYGLWKQRAWAEWLALVSGALLLPLEIRALYRGVTLLRCAVFLVNLAIVLYMYLLLRNAHRRRVQAAL